MQTGAHVGPQIGVKNYGAGNRGRFHGPWTCALEDCITGEPMDGDVKPVEPQVASLGGAWSMRGVAGGLGLKLRSHSEALGVVEEPR